MLKESALQVIDTHKWNNLSCDSSCQMATQYLKKFKPDSPLIVRTKTKPRKKSAITKNHEQTPQPDVHIVERPIFDESTFFQNLSGNENRRVNSLVDVRDLDYKSESTEKPQRKRKTPKYLDSEVDLMMTTTDNRPRIKYSDIAPKKPHNHNALLNAFKKAMLQTGAKKDAGKKKHMKAKGTNVTSIPSLTLPSPKKHKDFLDEHGHFMTKYPILTDKELVKKFLNVEMNNNQKGRIRQIMKEVVKGTSPSELPDVLNNKIQAILRSSEDLTDTDLRKIRILYNMLKKAIDDMWVTPGHQLKEKKRHQPSPKKTDEKPTTEEQKEKRKKRYVVFVGNLPCEVTKEQILKLFHDIQNDITDIRIPKVPVEGQGAIAYVELKNRHSYEMALSKHHMMMGKRRINVLYTVQKNTKLPASEIKARQAKLQALQKEGKLIGSMNMNKKRSQRRAKKRKAMAEQEKELSSKLLRVTNY